MNSLDPRVNRLPGIPSDASKKDKPPLDQFGTYEVFVQPKEGKPFQHEGIVHAPNLEMAYILAKEGFTRRFVCVSLYVVDTRDVLASPMATGDQNVYQQIEPGPPEDSTKKSFEVYHLSKRGKQHVHAGTLLAANPLAALSQARQEFDKGKPLCNVWIIPTDQIRFTSPAEHDLWITLPEKKFRDAAEYKGGDKLKIFIEGQRSKPVS